MKKQNFFTSVAAIILFMAVVLVGCQKHPGPQPAPPTPVPATITLDTCNSLTMTGASIKFTVRDNDYSVTEAGICYTTNLSSTPTTDDSKLVANKY